MKYHLFIPTGDPKPTRSLGPRTEKMTDHHALALFGKTKNVTMTTDKLLTTHRTLGLPKSLPNGFGVDSTTLGLMGERKAPSVKAVASSG